MDWTRACVVCSTPYAHRTRATCSKACRYALVSRRHKASGTKPPGFVTEAHREAARVRFTGSNHPRWRGGVYVNERGYRFVRPPAGFPWPAMADKRGYVRKHRLVMSLHLGRALSREEIVHHIDHDTGNNGLANLELVASHAEHIALHWKTGDIDPRPLCVFDCGRRVGLHKGRRFLGCARCRRLKRHRADPRRDAVQPAG